ncbi:MAG: DUF1116 domain-containing protein [Thermoanaerobacteraceae bacterium]|nr:DUF1116 domain-containing protein [Thermoanaerobacteraceae bacterium]
MIEELIENANREAIERVQNSQPTLVGIGIACDVIPDMDENLILHAGPPVRWEDMCGPMKGAVIGALIYEGRARDEDEAAVLASSGEIRFEPAHHHASVGPMAGIISSSMPVWIMENKSYGNRAYCTLNEGLGKVLRYGAYSSEVIGRLKWMEKILAPVLKEAMEIHGPVDMKTMIAQAVQMGDECHNRNKAGTSLFIREMATSILKTSFSNEDKISALEFLNENDHFFLNLSMPACKCTMDAAAGIKYSTLVVTQARNGVEFGIRVSGLGDRWFTGPAAIIDGLYFPGFSIDDANPDIGDSCITETTGLGGFAMAAAPAIVQFVGGTPKDAINFTQTMYEITLAESSTYRIPFLDFKGTPTGIDIRKVVETGIPPVINTGIAHKKPGIGQVGAGIVRPPMKCYEDALEAFVNSLVEEGLIEK